MRHKANPDTDFWRPLEAGTIRVTKRRARRVQITDGAQLMYLDAPLRAGQAVRFAARGAAGVHHVSVLDAAGRCVAATSFRLQSRTEMSCNRGPYAKLPWRIEQLLSKNTEQLTLAIEGRLCRMLVNWGRDHVHTLKAMKYFMADVKSGLEYWLESQEPNGMFWDCIHPNPNYPAPSWFGEALGPRFFWYDDPMKWIVRRIPVEADCEFLYAEGVWYVWKATGDDAWMGRQLPRLEKALRYNSSHPDRWSKKHRLVRRSMCMDSWDFANPHYCHGDHRCINPGDPQFLFHGDNSGLYSFYWRLAAMHEHLGNAKRAAELRRRANAKLFFGNIYGHMIPETLPPEEVYAKVGDERKRLSLSTGYTINRGLPTHEMAVKILREYQRRRQEKAGESFAEWWTMDPPYTPGQWPMQNTGGSSVGEYMNGGICTIIAGEIAKAAFEHGMEDYGADILERVWELSERDGGALHQVYRRLPVPVPPPPPARFQFVDLRAVVNRGLRHGASNVEAWTGEGDNDMRNLPTGRQKFGIIEFDIIKPETNNGRAVLWLEPTTAPSPQSSPPADGEEEVVPSPLAKGEGQGEGSAVRVAVANLPAAVSISSMPPRTRHHDTASWACTKCITPTAPSRRFIFGPGTKSVTGGIRPTHATSAAAPKPSTATRRAWRGAGRIHNGKMLASTCSAGTIRIRPNPSPV